MGPREEKLRTTADALGPIDPEIYDLMIAKARLSDFLGEALDRWEAWMNRFPVDPIVFADEAGKIASLRRSIGDPGAGLILASATGALSADEVDDTSSEEELARRCRDAMAPEEAREPARVAPSQSHAIDVLAERARSARQTDLADKLLLIGTLLDSELYAPGDAAKLLGLWAAELRGAATAASDFASELAAIAAALHPKLKKEEVL